MKVVISSSACISPQPTFKRDYFFRETVIHPSNCLKCAEPEYKDYINPMLLRKMPRIIKMGLGAAKLCLQEAGLDNPDAIITATGLGCMEDLEKFLISIIAQQEEVLSPTSFILSSHNMVSSQIALLLKNHGYNMNYCHRGFSFERALTDAMMLIEESPSKKVLVGGIDENTPDYFKIHAFLGYWKKEEIIHSDLINFKTEGTVAGEGAAFFLLENSENQLSGTVISFVETFYKKDRSSEIIDFLDYTLQSTRFQPDLILLGINGDARTDGIYFDLAGKYFSKDTGLAYFKHLCGEYPTASSFAFWLASRMLELQFVPEAVMIRKSQRVFFKNILIVNHFQDRDYSLIGVKREIF